MRSRSSSRSTTSKRRTPSTTRETSLPFDRRCNLIDDGRRLHAIKRRPLVVDGDFELRDADLPLDLKVDEARNGGKLLAKILADARERVEIVAKDFQGDLGADAREHVVEAMRDRLADVDRHRQNAELFADLGEDHVLASPRRVEIDFDLRGMDALGMFVEFGAAGAASDRFDLGNLQQQLLGDQADAVGFRQRYARREGGVDRQRAFVERRQEGARQVERRVARARHAECRQ